MTRPVTRRCPYCTTAGRCRTVLCDRCGVVRCASPTTRGWVCAVCAPDPEDHRRRELEARRRLRMAVADARGLVPPDGEHIWLQLDRKPQNWVYAHLFPLGDRSSRCGLVRLRRPAEATMTNARRHATTCDECETAYARWAA